MGLAGTEHDQVTEIAIVRDKGTRQDLHPRPSVPGAFSARWARVSHGHWLVTARVPVRIFVPIANKYIREQVVNGAGRHRRQLDGVGTTPLG